MEDMPVDDETLITGSVLPAALKSLNERIAAEAQRQGVGLDVLQDAARAVGTEFEATILSAVVGLSNKVRWQRQMEQARVKFSGSYDCRDLSEIRGQVAEQPTGQTELDTREKFSLAEAHERYGNGSLSELLDYAVRNSKEKLSPPIMIVWKVSKGDWFWAAELTETGCGITERTLDIHPEVEGNYLSHRGFRRFLKRTSAT